MQKVYFDPQTSRLVYLSQKSTPEFWNSKWESAWRDPKEINNTFYAKITKKYLPSGGKILEGGCGMGDKVYALTQAGFNVVGLDYDQKTLDKVKQHMPELYFTHGDVRELPFENSHFDGYWSFGVIEHFYEGYEKISSEMARVIKKDGFLFLTVPSVSKIRALKARLNKYPLFEATPKNIQEFYQFALPEKEVISHFSNKGFQLKELKHLDGIKGLKDEIKLSRAFVTYLYNGKNLPIKIIKKIVDVTSKKWFNHISLFVFKKVN